MIAEAQIEFFRRFDPARDRVWVAMENNVPRGALTIDGPRPENGREGARLRFFILDESLRGLGLGRRMMDEAMQYCREKEYRYVFLTTLPGLDAAMALYIYYGFCANRGKWAGVSRQPICRNYFGGSSWQVAVLPSVENQNRSRVASDPLSHNRPRGILRRDPNENLRLQNLWDGVETMAALLAMKYCGGNNITLNEYRFQHTTISEL